MTNLEKLYAEREQRKQERERREGKFEGVPKVVNGKIVKVKLSSGAGSTRGGI